MKYNPKQCPRCGTLFECKVEDIANCQCNISLAIETKQFLSRTFYDCLCASCLKNFENLVLSSKRYTFPTKADEFIEGVHYYKENGFFVFTEIYHFLRGYCCKNGCRHCVYGYKKE